MHDRTAIPAMPETKGPDATIHTTNSDTAPSPSPCQQKIGKG
jgi:hypothetical protein